MKDFDVSQMRANLGNYLEEIGDLLTTPQDVERYAEFTASLYKINALTKRSYQIQPDGTLPKLEENTARELQEAYRTALDQSAQLQESAETGEVGKRMRNIVRELTPLLRSDNTALELYDAQKEPMSLPELIGRCRSQAVDLGEQQTDVSSGQVSSRQHIQIQGENSVEDGYFTETVRAQPEKDFKNLMAKLENKYPAYAPLLEKVKEQDVGAYMFVNLEPYKSQNIPEDLQECKDYLKDHWRRGLYHLLGVEKEITRPLEERADYYQFMDEFSRGAKQCARCSRGSVISFSTPSRWYSPRRQWSFR